MENQCGQLSIEDQQFVLSPTLIMNDKEIKDFFVFNSQK